MLIFYFNSLKTLRTMHITSVIKIAAPANPALKKKVNSMKFNDQYLLFK